MGGGGGGWLCEARGAGSGDGPGQLLVARRDRGDFHDWTGRAFLARCGVPEARRAVVEEVKSRGGEVEGEKLAPTPKRPRPLLMMGPSLNPNPV